jgi:hypothetical protein
MTKTINFETIIFIVRQQWVAALISKWNFGLIFYVQSTFYKFLSNWFRKKNPFYSILIFFSSIWHDGRKEEKKMIDT